MTATGPTPHHAVPPIDASSVEGFDRIADYELLELIGKGGMGRVFKAHQISLSRIVALKILPPALARNHTFTLRFLNEARASGKLIHPNVVQGIDCGQDEGSGLWYFAMEYVDGYSLADELKRNRTLSEERAIEVGIAIASALEVAAKHGIVHRDIKPENILVSRHTDEIKLADLGVAKLTHEENSSITRTENMVGTPYYVAPEQARGKSDQIDTRSDIYALGATLFHLVTGQPPYDGSTCADIMAKHIQDKVPLAHHVAPEISESFSRVIAKMMQKKSNQRYQTPPELRAALERAKLGVFQGRGETSRADLVPLRTTTPRTVDHRPGSGRQRHPVTSGSNRPYLICGAAALLLSLLALACFILPPNPEATAASSRRNPDPLPPLLPPPTPTITVPVPASTSSESSMPRTAIADPVTVRGRFVRIELPGENRVLSLAEVEIFSGSENVARKGSATQSSTAFSGAPGRALDGRTDGVFSRNSISHTKPSRSPYWEVDLGREYTIDRIVIWTRTDDKCKYAGRLANFSLSVINEERTPVCRIDQVPAPSLKCILLPVIETGQPARLTWSMPPDAPPVEASDPP